MFIAGGLMLERCHALPKRCSSRSSIAGAWSFNVRMPKVQKVSYRSAWQKHVHHLPEHIHHLPEHLLYQGVAGVLGDAAGTRGGVAGAFGGNARACGMLLEPI
ncbi:hypothetical protein AMTR_s00036p00059010 [Amborella trichopoda]|uniref:Uncharacterized protein n=1 Tax=Amborella trichopoda TaxID=13333 RepID=U5CQ44_AMBTC|nr:hypothetical protein AMTR_s00036p00059010 [Amborella trichopoda]